MIYADIEAKINTKNGNEILLLKQEPKDRDYEKTVLIAGVIHGEEPDGEYLINRYLSNKTETKNRLLFIPCLNTDGKAQNKRTNANNVDINRKDVYKRQAIRYGKIKITRMSNYHDNYILPYINYETAVSYTHLDVYKRQDPDYIHFLNNQQLFCRVLCDQKEF